MKPFCTMLKTEWKLSLRGMDMVLFAICLPLVVLVILGILYRNQPAYDGAGHTFLEQSFGAIATIPICAGGVMGLPLVISEYRNRKILKRFQVTPVTPALILLIQILVYTLYAACSLVLLWLTGKIFFGLQLHGSTTLFLCGYLLVLLSMFSIGILVGGVSPNPKTAGVIASILYFPMLIFSGATLPYEVMPEAMQRVADIMPLTQGIKLLKAASLQLPIDYLLLPTIVMIVIAVSCSFVAVKFFRWE